MRRPEAGISTSLQGPSPEIPILARPAAERRSSPSKVMVVVAIVIIAVVHRPSTTNKWTSSSSTLATSNGTGVLPSRLLASVARSRFSPSPPRGFHNQEVALHARGTNKIRFFYTTLQEPDQHPGRCNLVSGGMNDIGVWLSLAGLGYVYAVWTGAATREGCKCTLPAHSAVTQEAQGKTGPGSARDTDPDTDTDSNRRDDIRSRLPRWWQKGGWNQQAQRKHASCTMFREWKRMGSIHTTLQNEPGPDSHVEARHSFFFSLFLSCVAGRSSEREPVRPISLSRESTVTLHSGPVDPALSRSVKSKPGTHFMDASLRRYGTGCKARQEVSVVTSV